jgi:hypothetical protein
MVRFLDPFGSPSAWRFHLDSRRPSAELLVATDWDDRPLHFVVSPASTEVTVEIRDWRGLWRTVVPQAPPEPPGLITVSPSRPWRRHAYWWQPGRLYGSRVLRMSLIDAAPPGFTAVIRYAGRGRELAPLSAQLLKIDPLPTARVEAATAISTTLRVRNTGRRPWSVAGLFPVTVGYRLLSGVQGRVVERGSTPLPRSVRPGEILEAGLTVQWPDQPGSYQLAFDLLREPVSDLKRLGRLVLFSAEVDVEGPISPDTPTP